MDRWESIKSYIILKVFIGFVLKASRSFNRITNIFQRSFVKYFFFLCYTLLNCRLFINWYVYLRTWRQATLHISLIDNDASDVSSITVNNYVTGNMALRICMTVLSCIRRYRRSLEYCIFPGAIFNNTYYHRYRT